MAKFGFHGTVLHPVEQDWVSKKGWTWGNDWADEEKGTERTLRICFDITLDSNASPLFQGTTPWRHSWGGLVRLSHGNTSIGPGVQSQHGIPLGPRLFQDHILDTGDYDLLPKELPSVFVACAGLFLDQLSEGNYACHVHTPRSEDYLGLFVQVYADLGHVGEGTHVHLY